MPEAALSEARAIAADPLTEAESLDLVGVAAAREATAYVWDLTNDRIQWESNALALLGVDDLEAVATGQAFERCIAVEHLGRRLSAIATARSPELVSGVPYRIRFRFKPSRDRGRAAIHLEDQGRWWPGADGAPLRARGVLRIVNDASSEELRLQSRNDFDELTGQLNRMRLCESLSVTLDRARREGRSACFMIIAVNNLAVINETFGFDVGDEAIAAAGHKMRQKLRSGDVIGRYSSNKFGVIVQECGPGAMRTAAERLMRAVRDQPIATSTCQLSITVSIGGVIIPDQADAVQPALNNALRALDRARGKRFDCFMAYEPNAGADTTRTANRAIADSVIEALDQKRMRLALQPMMSAKTGKPEIYECLLRMEKRDGGLVAAGAFIPVAEQLGLSRLIDRRTLELAIDLLKRHPDLRLAVNVSGLTCTDHEWLVTLQRLTGSRRDILSRLVVEITETAAIQDLDQSINFVDTLKDLGCSVAIDDFGAGYTSFKNLKMLNVDIVKIDGVFVKNLAHDTSDRIFIKTLVELAQTFDMETVAEWVADAESVAYLTGAGITYLQGFHYGLPFDSAEYRSEKTLRAATV